ncbi:MAG: Rieske 2Fe-2S domain-containing protein [Planctomycetes bacterium]|nr:Rieske 2Fe-2S domain-containing protein [Planctomycetota bacterium]MBI3844187.1 Rieske 2Fe-2S domain-containing protein [Planctomycetota bacterium]
MTRVEVAKLAEFPPGARKVVKVGDESVLVLNVDGQLVACANACPHARYPLDEGLVEKGEIVCLLHGFAFRLSDGAGTTDTELHLPIYTVFADGDTIVVELAN